MQRFRAGREQESEREAISRARSRRALERQRSRFKNVLNNNKESSVDDIVDPSLSPSFHRVNAMATIMNGGSDGTAAIISPMDAGDDEDEALSEGPESWDPVVRKEWEAFVRSSKMGGVEMWDPSEIDEGMPKVWVDLNKE